MSDFFETRERVIRYETFEIYHVAIGTSRYVNKQFIDKTFTLESDAPRNSGEAVEFTAASFDLSHPEISEDSVLSMTVQLGRVGQDIKSKLKAINKYTNDYPNTETTQFIYREFINGVPSRIILWVKSTTIDGNNVALIASDDNPNAIGVSRRYRAQDFLGLKVLG